VLLIGRTLFDPAFEDRNLLGFERLVRPRRGHDDVRIGRRDPLPQRTLVEIAGNDRRRALPDRQRAIRHIQPQIRLAVLGVEPVAGETVRREDRPDVAVELHLLRPTGLRPAGGSQ
jgi:hypothetical protein